MSPTSRTFPPWWVGSTWWRATPSSPGVRRWRPWPGRAWRVASSRPSGAPPPLRSTRPVSLISAVAVGAIRAPEPKPAPPEGGHPRLAQGIAEGLRFVFGNALLRAIAATTATSNLFSGIAAAVEIVFLVRQVHASAGVIGLLFALGGVGGVLGALAAGPIARRFGGARATIIGIAGQRRRTTDPPDDARGRAARLRLRISSWGLLCGGLQRQSSQLPPAPLSRPAPRAHERDHALRRLGGASHRGTDRRHPGRGLRAADHALGRRGGSGVRRDLAARLADAEPAGLPRRASRVGARRRLARRNRCPGATGGAR